jgi:4-hydroxy-tetrahydrodipicolinate synthase
MMVAPEIKAGGVISVASNIVPGAVVEMVSLLEQDNQTQARILLSQIEPLFNLVTVKTKEETSYGDVVFRARNPLAVKTLMTILGMPSGGCRRPLGKMTKKGLDTVLETARKIQTDSPDIFQPVADFFGVDIDERLSSPSNWEGLCYEEY